MAEVAILIPVLDRPHRVLPLLSSITDSLSRPVFLCSPNDTQEIRAVRRAGADMIVVEWEPGQGDYARKMNRGFTDTTEPYVFLAADDLVFTPDWAERAIAKHLESGCPVVGTNDLGSSRVISGEHSTHTLVHRSYGAQGTIDDPGKLLHEGYWHNFVDDEFIETAKQRGAYAAAVDSHVEHLHWCWNKGTKDGTYERALGNFETDRLYYERRRILWGNTARTGF